MFYEALFFSVKTTIIIIVTLFKDGSSYINHEQFIFNEAFYKNDNECDKCTRSGGI